MSVRLKRKMFHCQRCGHLWFSKLRDPIACAKCKSPYWRTKPKKGRGDQEQP